MEGEPPTADQHKQQQPKAAAAAAKESTSRLLHSLVNAAATAVAALNSTGIYDVAPTLLPVWRRLALAPNERANTKEKLLEYTRKKESNEARTLHSQGTHARCIAFSGG